MTETRATKPPELKFGPTTTIHGFLSSDIASFSDLRPTRIVRELLQNSLDAAVEAGESQAIVRFKASMMEVTELPDVDGYESAFREAVEDQTRMSGSGELSDAAQQVVNTIEQALRDLRRSGVCCLSVLDNGVGLDDKRMNALLGDGAGSKDPELAGSYGVGHLSAIPASDFRYLLYGGVVATGRRIFSGVAILASRIGRQGGFPCAGCGYLVDEFKSGENGAYEFTNAAVMPTLIENGLQEIETEWGHGTVVVIPAFNQFNGDFQLWDVVSKVSAYNFNAAIHKGRLVVEVDDPSTDDGSRIGVRRLDSNTLRGVLEKESEHVRSARKDSFFGGLRPSGFHAHAAWRTLCSGTGNRVTTSLGEIDVSLLEPAPTGSTRVDLYRNDMWITDNVLGLRRADFSSRRPFHAVLMLDRHNEFHRLVRKAEGPMHDALEFARLSRRERTTLRQAFRETGEWIKSRIPKLSTDDYTPDDFLVVEAGGDEPGRASTEEYSLWGTPVVVQRPPRGPRVAGAGKDDGQVPAGDKPGSGSKERRKRPRGRRTTRPLPFRSTAVPNGDGKYVIALECRESVDELLLSLRVDENTDATCDRVWPDEDVPLREFRVRESRGQSQVAGGQLTEDKKAIRLSGLTAGRVYELTVEHEVTRERFDGGVTTALRVDLHRPVNTGGDDGDDG